MSNNVSSELYLPGQPIVAVKDGVKKAGDGTYVSQGLIRASLVGQVNQDAQVRRRRVFRFWALQFDHFRSQSLSINYAGNPRNPVPSSWAPLLVFSHCKQCYLSR
jgi:hypothetical protein